jgi:hypothetical protein
MLYGEFNCDSLAQLGSFVYKLGQCRKAGVNKRNTT